MIMQGSVVALTCRGDDLLNGYSVDTVPSEKQLRGGFNLTLCICWCGAGC